MARPTTTPSLAVAAIDFGTTCTGYAYFLRSKSERKPSDINVEQQWTGSSEMGLQAPTTVLMKPNKTFDSFGFEAENTYKTLTLRNGHKDWFYFRHFKMKLHHEKDLSRDMPLKEAGGKTMKAIYIFAMAIKYVKEHLLTKLTGLDIHHKDISWIITVPAIWRDSAKQFMKEAAAKAGIPDNQLRLALEPESAAIFCKELALTKVGGVDGALLRAFDPHQKYIVVDCGGGTVDTTGHVIQEDGKLKELHAATGGPWGGEQVNEAFEVFMEKLVTRDVLRQFKLDYTSAWIEFEKNFERKKREYSTKRRDVDLPFPPDLETAFTAATKCTLHDRVKQDNFGGEIELLQRNILLTPKLMDDFFKNATDEINAHIALLLKKEELRDVSTLLLVGGFSESSVVSGAVRDRFPKLRVIAPSNGSIAILKGAVMYGCDPDVIAARISPYSYGVHTRALYNKSRHGTVKTIKNKGRVSVDDVFDKHLTVGEYVYVGVLNTSRKYRVCNKSNLNVFWKVYQSTLLDPVFCDDKNQCKFLGKLSVTIPRAIKEDNVELTLSMTCRGTELEAKAAVPRHNVQCVTKFDFLDVTEDSDEIVESIDSA